MDGFTNGFDLHYEGPENRKDTSSNIPITVGSKAEMWNKVMKEVKESRLARPYETFPFEHYVQSPIGLVPKAQNKTRLIFHLSYNFSEEDDDRKSINHYIPKELCSVKYNDLDAAVKACFDTRDFATCQFGEQKPVIFLGKSDGLNAFRQIPLARKYWKFLVIMAEDPNDGNKKKYFVDKCLPFSSSISCAIYQHVSDALAHLMHARECEAVRVFCVVNYLDDFLFIEITKARCNALMQRFLDLCEDISLPASLEKTEWAEPLMVFLGNLLNGRNMTISIPLDKKQKALRLLNDFQGKKKSTVKQLRILTGFLNFLSRAIFPGRVFTRRI